MKRYIVFSYMGFNPLGGWDDVWRTRDKTVVSYYTIEEVVDSIMKTDPNPNMDDIMEVVDLETGEIVKKFIAGWIEKKIKTPQE